MGDAAFTPSKSFHDAANFVSKAPQLKNVSNEIKLELYALYKMVTVARSPNTTRPGYFDFTNRAKWDEWKKTSDALSDLSTEEVEARYLERCESLGWVPASESKSGDQAAPVTSAKAEQEEEEDVHDIDWDAPIDPAKNGHGGRAMGNKVSVLQADEDQGQEDSTTLHGLAVLGDAEKLRTLIDLDKDLDIDEKDEFGYTALHLAADRGNTAVVELLLKRGADQGLLDADGFSAIELANASGKEEVVSLLKQAS